MAHTAKAKKQSRPRVNTAIPAAASYQIRSQQQGQNSSSASSGSSSSSYTWTAADSARDSENGACLTAWPPDEPFYIPPIPLLGQNSQAHQHQAQPQNQTSQHHHSTTYQSSAVPYQGGSASGK
ncbi:hypothetical protein F5B19DRAFT_131992 [Rostrohypoxylon terebratum]|nr:hypothetical protein F5B19DRAFT_131992 [Rostrohypoxylon terebratum]